MSTQPDPIARDVKERLSAFYLDVAVSSRGRYVTDDEREDWHDFEPWDGEDYMEVDPDGHVWMLNPDSPAYGVDVTEVLASAGCLTDSRDWIIACKVTLDPTPPLDPIAEVARDLGIPVETFEEVNRNFKEAAQREPKAMDPIRLAEFRKRGGELGFDARNLGQELLDDRDFWCGIALMCTSTLTIDADAPPDTLDPIEAQHWRDLRDARAHLVAAKHLVESARLHRNAINGAREGSSLPGQWWDNTTIRSHIVEAIATLPDMPKSSAGIMPPSTVAEPEGAEGIGS